MCLTWFEAEAYAAWRGGRLPTEAEWEYAARGPKSTVYPWGDAFDREEANVLNSVAPQPVGSYPTGASWVGAEQLSGNVWEWVAGTGDDGWVTVRGGSYLDHEWGVRASRALDADPARATDTTGFRIAIDVRRYP